MKEEEKKEITDHVISEVTNLLKENGISEAQITEKIKSLDIEAKMNASNAEVVKIKSELQNEIKLLQEEVAKSKSNGDKKGLNQELKEIFKAKHKDILNAMSSGRGEVEIYKMKSDLTPDMSTARITSTSMTNVVRDWNNTDSKSGVKLRTPRILDLVTAGVVSRPYFSYGDIVPVHNDSTFGYATAVSEGAIKPKVAFAFENRQAVAKKVAAYMAITDEADLDIDFMSQNASDYLMKRVELAKAKSVITAVNTAAPSFDPATWAGGAVVTPNLRDVIIACMNQIVNAENWADDVQFVPNVALVNWNDFIGMSVTKDKNEAYLFAEGIRTALGVEIIPVHKNDVAVGEILVGDFSMAEVYAYENYNVKTGYINDQLIYNMFTIVGETRFIELVRNYNKVGFVKGDIATIKSAIAGS